MEELVQNQNYEAIIENYSVSPELKLLKHKEIKTIIFDLGGVYFTMGTRLAIERIKKIYKIQNYDLLKYVFSNEFDSAGKQIRLGRISIDEFESRVAPILRIQKSQKNNIRHLWFGSYLPNYKMEDVIKSLYKSNKYKLVIFSGNIRERIEYLDKKYDFLKYFDETVFSFDYSLSKRDTAFYYELLNHIECEASQALVIDDNSFVLEKAEYLGFNTIQYSYTEQFIEELRKYNIMVDIDF